jgi:hypothetical protein
MSDEPKVRAVMLAIEALILALAGFSWFFLPILINRKAKDGISEEHEPNVRQMLDVFRQIGVGCSLLAATIWGTLTYAVWFGMPDFVLKLLPHFRR